MNASRQRDEIRRDGGTHGDDPVQVFKDLRTVVADVVESDQAEGKPLPEPRDLVAA